MTNSRSNASRIYNRLRVRIIRCEVEPGKKMKIADLAAEFDASPGAVREALSRLSSERLVIATDQRGFHAAPITLSDLEDLTESRVEMESLLLRRAIANSTPAVRDRIASAEAALLAYKGESGSDRAAALHGDFHDALVEASGSPTLLRIRHSLYELTQRYRFFALLVADVERDTADEHRRIAGAVIAGDADLACRAMGEHIRRTADIVKAALNHPAIAIALPAKARELVS